jgi:predicted SnoaL-like aldol condensation-catalyzing enzyme
MAEPQDRATYTVARDHLDAVLTGDPEAMAADYALDAKLTRGDEVHEGRPAILAYFRTVPERLGDSIVVFDDLAAEGNIAIVQWHLSGGAAASGTDTLRVADGLIVDQMVHLNTSDF